MDRTPEGTGGPTRLGRWVSVPFRWRMMGPLLILLGLILAYPLGYSAWLSLHDYRIVKPDRMPFVGLDQYAKVFTDQVYRRALLNTFLFVFMAVTLELVLGFLLALALHRQKLVRSITRAVLLTPMFITPIAVGLMFRFLLSEQLGLIPNILGVFGFSFNFFGPYTALPSLALIDVWQWTPFMMLLLLAGLESLPEEPFEAARVAGASRWFTLTRVTVPLMRPVIVVAVLIRSLDALKIFEYVFAITRGGPGLATETLQYHVYRVGFKYYRMSEAAAVAWTIVLIVMVLILVLLWQEVGDDTP